MLILRHNTLSAEDLFVIECRMIKIADPTYKVKDLSDFTVLEKSRAELYGYILGFLERLGLCESLGVTPSEFLDFLVDVDHGYLTNAYHSFYHAVDVTIVLYHMICNYDIGRYISRIDIAALLIAGLCHDIGHPGKNNNFQVNLQTDLAVRYSNKSVLESYSCTITMDLLTKHKLLRHLEKSSKSFGLPTTESEMRTAIIKMILATDMIFHYELQENLTNLLEIITDENGNGGNGRHGRSTLHKPVLPPTNEEIEEELVEETGNNADKAEANIEIATKASDQPTLINNKDHQHNHDVQVKDIFSHQGAKSAISYFRRKSYFDDDAIPLPLNSISELPDSPEEDDKSENENRREEYRKFFVATERHHASGIDLVLSNPENSSSDANDKKSNNKHIHKPPNFIVDYHQRLILCQIVLHAADISNALRPWPICFKWSNLVCEEFFLQGDAEKKHGIKVSPNMDRSQVSQSTIGLQFGDFVVSPYFEIFAAFFPKAEQMLQTLADNRVQWLQLEEKDLQEKKESGQHNEEKQNEEEEEEENQTLPSNMLPDRPILNPSGRRVSVAAGMIVIPDELEEKTIGSGKHKRKYWGIRSVSHSDISSYEERERARVLRRRSEEPNLVAARRSKFVSKTPNSNKEKERSTTLSATSQQR
ncbi:hypothetical protein BDF20DRAFT_878548 [Mycotypha africana]|uniref:uncharacterized protein n=1 Tax=Mycotypha africana TaxID=64632 RepID=UPI0022FFCCC8|nr:uncharacterized protein BDF20DRAFT_878548 [Mycotypha africana]KAI8975412.1 hypothetical protein BDF20DRAFT_878548 [Mycotypha africana]